MSIKGMAERVLTEFSTRCNKERPLIVGVDGLSGAGKTTFIKKIEQELSNNNCEVVTFHLDDHIVERDKRYQTGHEEWYEYYYLQWNVKGVITNLFEPLHNSCKNINLPYYDKFTDSTVTKQITVASDSIVLIEGIFLQRDEWKAFYDFIIFLDCPRELRYERVLNRDLYIGDYQARLTKYQRRYWLGEKHYLDSVIPINSADLVYNA